MAGCGRRRWKEAFARIADKMRPADSSKVGALAGQLAAVEEIFALKQMMGALGVKNIDARYPGSPLHPKYGRASYLFNSTIAGIEQADAIMLIGTNPRKEVAGAQCAHPQALPQGQCADRRHRRAGRPDLSL